MEYEIKDSWVEQALILYYGGDGNDVIFVAFKRNWSWRMLVRGENRLDL